MIEGLFSILRNVIINISNCVPGNVIDKMFDAEKLVVLLNNPSPSIKIIILKVSLKLVLLLITVLYYIHLKFLNLVPDNKCVLTTM